MFPTTLREARTYLIGDVVRFIGVSIVCLIVGLSMVYHFREKMWIFLSIDVVGGLTVVWLFWTYFSIFYDNVIHYQTNRRISTLFKIG